MFLYTGDEPAYIFHKKWTKSIPRKPRTQTLHSLIALPVLVFKTFLNSNSLLVVSFSEWPRFIHLCDSSTLIHQIVTVQPSFECILIIVIQDSYKL